MNSPTDKPEIELLKEKVEKVVEEGDESVLDRQQIPVVTGYCAERGA